MHAMLKQPNNEALNALCAKASACAVMPGAYAGEVSPLEAWEFLYREGGALVDVRTQAEWTFTGEPDVSETRGALIKLSWKLYPTFALNPQFAERLRQQAHADTPLFFLCRSGGRSLDAAIAMQEAGFRYCFNVSGGFEGEPDAQSHRGTREGWKAAGLSWRQG